MYSTPPNVRKIHACSYCDNSNNTAYHINQHSCLCFVVCTCVVHKRCHQNVVTKCPKEKDAGVDSSLVSSVVSVLIIAVHILNALHINGVMPLG